MNFNQLTAAAAAAAAAGNPNNNLSMSSFTTAVSNILASSNIDLSQFANIGPHLPAFSAALELNRRNRDQQQHHQSSRQNLHQAHRSAGSNHHQTNQNSLVDHLPSSMSNLQNADAAAAAAVSVAGLPASITNLTSSALADLAANAAAAAAANAAHQPQAHSGRSSIQSAHHRSSSSNHHSTNQLTAAHQSTSAANKAAANLAAHQHHHQSQQHHQHHQHQNTIHHRHSSSLHHNSLSNHNHSINNINNHSNNLSNHNNSTSLMLNNSTNSLLNSSILPASTATIIATNNTNSITPPKDSICYRIGDCVYFESTSSSSSTTPNLPSPQQYQIGRIDEICKTPNTNATTANNTDNIEVKVVVFFRRRDISSSLMTLADKYQYDETQEEEIKLMSEKDKNLLKQREMFYSRQIETIPATSIRGKCTVQLLNESESLASYLNKEDHYFYTLVYDPQQKTITADRGEIRVGQRYQAEVQPNPIYTPQAGGDPADPRDLSELETLVYTPDHNLTDDDINKFLTIAKSVGTFARALDCSSSIKQPSLHLTAASASRDVTLLYAMQLLHQNNYDLGKAVCALVPSTGPVLCRDEIEEWTAGEATLFEEAIEKYGREFGDIRQDFLPWKSVKNIVEYYYMWKTTDRSINQRRMKALEAENKVTILYISDPENEIKVKIRKSPINVPAPTPTNTSGPETQNNNDRTNNNSNNNNLTAPSESGKTAPTTAASTLSSSATTTRSGSALKKTQESEDSSMNSNMENTNATLKRRQVTEPKLSAHVACHTTPGENLRFISTKRHKVLRRGMINRKQLRHLCRRPWERRVKSRT